MSNQDRKMVVFGNLIDVDTGKPIEIEASSDDVKGLKDISRRAEEAANKFKKRMFS